MLRQLYPIGFAIIALISLADAQAQRMGTLGKDDKEARGTLRYRGEGITDVEWSATRSSDADSETVVRILHSLAGSNKRAIVQEEETRTRIDSETTKVTRTTSSFDSRGDTRVTEVVEEQTRLLGNGEKFVERNIALPDSRGDLSVYRQEVQSSVPVGPDATESVTSVYLRSGSGEFEEQERIEESERRLGDTTEVAETTLEVDANGRWTTRSKRTVTSTVKDGKLEREEEKVYWKDSRGELSLSEHVISTYSEDSRGNGQWVVETHSKTIGGTRRTPQGRLQLNRRVSVVTKKLPGGTEQTIEEVQERSPANPRSGLEVVERTITTSRPSKDGGRELEIEVQASDGNGRFKTILTQKTSVSK